MFLQGGEYLRKSYTQCSWCFKKKTMSNAGVGLEKKTVFPLSLSLFIVYVPLPLSFFRAFPLSIYVLCSPSVCAFLSFPSPCMFSHTSPFRMSLLFVYSPFSCIFPLHVSLFPYKFLLGLFPVSVYVFV